MKAEELAVIKERAEKATDGPWLSDEYDDSIRTKHIDHARICTMSYLNENDAQFIANAREDVPKLVAEVERLQARLCEANQLVVNAYTLMAEIQNYHGTKSRIERYLSGVGNE